MCSSGKQTISQPFSLMKLLKPNIKATQDDTVCLKQDETNIFKEAHQSVA